MAKTKFQIEYLLNTSSKAILWKYISTPAGYEKWFADKVLSNGDNYTFIWGQNEEKRAVLLSMKHYSHVRFRWEEDANSKNYFELRMRQNELTEDCVLEIVDFADEDDKDDLIELWDSEVETLRRISGI